MRKVKNYDPKLQRAVIRSCAVYVLATLIVFYDSDCAVRVLWVLLLVLPLLIAVAMRSIVAARSRVLFAILHSIATSGVVYVCLWRFAGSRIPILSPRSLAILAGAFLTLIGFYLLISEIWARLESCRMAVIPGCITCRRCGYRVDNIPSDRCPECGSEESAETADDLSRRPTVWGATGFTVGLLLFLMGYYGISTFGARGVLLCLFENRNNRSEMTLNFSLWMDSNLSSAQMRVFMPDLIGLLGGPDYLAADDSGETWVYKYTAYGKASSDAIFFDFDAEGYLNSIGWNTLAPVLDAVKEGRLRLVRSTE